MPRTITLASLPFSCFRCCCCCYCCFVGDTSVKKSRARWKARNNAVQRWFSQSSKTRHDSTHASIHDMWKRREQQETSPNITRGTFDTIRSILLQHNRLLFKQILIYNTFFFYRGYRCHSRTVLPLSRPPLATWQRRDEFICNWPLSTMLSHDSNAQFPTASRPEQWVGFRG